MDEVVIAPCANCGEMWELPSLAQGGPDVGQIIVCGACGAEFAIASFEPNGISPTVPVPPGASPTVAQTQESASQSGRSEEIIQETMLAQARTQETQANVEWNYSEMMLNEQMHAQQMYEDQVKPSTSLPQMFKLYFKQTMSRLMMDSTAILVLLATLLLCCLSFFIGWMFGDAIMFTLGHLLKSISGIFSSG